MRPSVSPVAQERAARSRGHGGSATDAAIDALFIPRSAPAPAPAPSGAPAATTGPPAVAAAAAPLSVEGERVTATVPLTRRLLAPVASLRGKDRSCGVLGAAHPLRRRAHALLASAHFDRVVFAAIAVSSGLLTLEYPGMRRLQPECAGLLRRSAWVLTRTRLCV